MGKLTKKLLLQYALHSDKEIQKLTDADFVRSF